MSIACGASIFLFELFKRKNLEERGLLGFNNMMNAMHEYRANNKLL